MPKGDRVLITSNEAIGEAAIRAGLHFYAGYPITPQNELTAYMAAEMPPRGRVFLQSESEVAAINMVFGASLAGARAMTSSSSPGISLKQEGISYMAGCRLPGIIVNIMRGGPGLGNIAGSQSDYFQATRGGGHGDYRCMVYGPWSAQEAADLVYGGFDISERYRVPVILLLDGYLGQTMETVTLPPPLPEVSKDRFDWILTGACQRPARKIRSLLMGEGELEAHNRLLEEVYREIEARECRAEIHGSPQPELLIVAFGLSARQAAEAVERARERGRDVALFRPISLWPFPVHALRKAAERARRILVVEMNLGQMVEDVRLALGDRVPIEFLGRPGGGVPTVREILGKLSL